MSLPQRVQILVYHGFRSDRRPAFRSNDVFDVFVLSDTILDVRDKVATYLNIPKDLILLFDTDDIAKPLNYDTLLSTFATSDNSDTNLNLEPSKIKLYFGLRRCKRSLEIVERRKAVHPTDLITILWRLNIKGFGADKMITTVYTNFNAAEIYEYVEAFTGLPKDYQILISNDKKIIRYTSESVFKGKGIIQDSILLHVVAYFKENEKIDEICLEYGIKHLKSLKLRFLTNEEELNAREIESIQDIKNYVHKTHNIPPRQQSILFQHQEIKNDSTKIFDLFSQNENFKGEMHLNAVIEKKTFNIEVVVHFWANHSETHFIEICDSDNIIEVKMKILRRYYSWGLEDITKRLNSTSFKHLRIESKIVTDIFNLKKDNTIFQDKKTVEECNILPNSTGNVMLETILVRICLDSKEMIVEYSIPKHHYYRHLYETLKSFMEEYGVHNKELHLISGQLGVFKDPVHCWKIQKLDGDVCVIEYVVVKKAKETCHIL